MVSYNDRITQLRKLYPEKAFIFYDNISRTYLSGFHSSEERDGILIITPKSALFFIDSRYIEAAKKEIKHIKMVEVQSYISVFKDTTDILKADNVQEVFIDGNRISLNLYRSIKKSLKGIKLKSKDNILNPLRLIKDEHEIANITKAVGITEKAFYKTIEIIKPGISESDLAAELEYQMKKFGGLGPGFESIVLFGARTSLPHGVPQHDVFCREKEVILMDFGVDYNHYTSDVTRTFFLGEPTKKMKEVYLAVLRANQKVFDKIKIGMTFKKVDSIARNEIEKAGYGDKFIHSLGHGIGLEIHEPPFLSSKTKRGHLEAGMTFTDEPGIYLKNEFGVRLEDDIYLTETGPILLTSGIKKDLLIL